MAPLPEPHARANVTNIMGKTANRSVGALPAAAKRRAACPFPTPNFMGVSITRPCDGSGTGWAASSGQFRV